MKETKVLNRQNAPNPNANKGVESMREIEKRERDQELDDISWLLSDRRGRRYIWKYLEFCGIFKTSFTGNSFTYFNEGKRNAGLKLFSDIMTACPNVYIMMANENSEDINLPNS